MIFECKNHASAVKAIYIREFSDKISNIFRHACKGVVVVSSRLQSGAENIAKSRGVGIVKYDERGFEVIAQRKGGIGADSGFIKSQIFNDTPVKPLKFSAYYDGSFFSSVDHFLGSLGKLQPVKKARTDRKSGDSIPYISNGKIQQTAHRLLGHIRYSTGPVDLIKVCSVLSLDLSFTQLSIQDANGEPILESANFGLKSIQIHSHNNKHRERFTLAHEVGHFYLGHDQYLQSESIVEHDLLATDKTGNAFDYERLETQANLFASELLLPVQVFSEKVENFRRQQGIIDKGHGYIFVDDQPCNYSIYHELLTELSSYFDVSQHAIEIKLKRMQLLTDQRTKRENFTKAVYRLQNDDGTKLRE